MNIIPAIDIINGQCVRLEKGDFRRRSVYGKYPLEQAMQMGKAGIRHLHIVDLDAAKTGRLVNRDIINSIARYTRLIIDYGGGITNITQVKQLLDSGVSAVNIGSLAIRDPLTFRDILQEFGPEKIILSADVDQGKIAISGWQENSGISIYDFLEEQLSLGIRRVCCTDIQRDGMFTGPAVELYREILRRFPQIRLTASGGIGSMEHISMLSGLKLEAVIVGKALYEGRITLNQLAERC